MDAQPDWEDAYRRSRYAFPWRGRWREFALDGAQAPAEEPRLSVTLITAWNPGSREMPRPWNEAANARLLRELVARRVPWAPAWGGSLPGVEPPWREEGFALLGLSRAEAAAWGRRCGQRAVVWLDPRSAGLLFCDGDRYLPCGLRHFF